MPPIKEKDVMSRWNQAIKICKMGTCLQKNIFSDPLAIQWQQMLLNSFTEWNLKYFSTSSYRVT